MKKRILCYGDSNTYGANPRGGRHDESTRWPMRLQTLLGADYTVIEEGLCGRTTVFDDPAEGGHRSGIDYFPVCLMSHQPLDAVAIMLGTNDTKQRFGMSAYTIASAAAQLVQCARQYAFTPVGRPVRVLLIAPPEIGDWVSTTLMGPIFGPHAAEISRGFAHEYERFSRLMNCDFFNAAACVQPSRADGVHLTAEAHDALARALAVKLRAMLGGIPQQV